MRGQGFSHVICDTGYSVTVLGKYYVTWSCVVYTYVDTSRWAGSGSTGKWVRVVGACPIFVAMWANCHMLLGTKSDENRLKFRKFVCFFWDWLHVESAAFSSDCDISRARSARLFLFCARPFSKFEKFCHFFPIQTELQGSNTGCTTYNARRNMKRASINWSFPSEFLAPRSDHNQL